MRLISAWEQGFGGRVYSSAQGDGLAFLHAGGTIVKKELNNEALLIDTGRIVLPWLDYDIQRAEFKIDVFGGEGLFLPKFGTGKVYLQSLPFRAWPIASFKMPQRLGERLREGSILGELGRFIDGDN